MIEFVTGDMFEDDSDVRVNTVNCVGVMGKGVALAFRNKYPKMFLEYKQACKNGSIRPGKLQVWKGDDHAWVVNFPTKRHWRDKSRYSDIADGLKALREYLMSLGHVKVSIPALGCGHGGLDWNTVKTMIESSLSGLGAQVLIRVYSPEDSRKGDKK